MQIRTVDSKTVGKVIEFVRWEYNAEERRSRSKTLGRMNASWSDAPAPVLARFTPAEMEEYRQFKKAKDEAEKLHSVLKSPEQTAKNLAVCLDRFRLAKDEVSQEQAVSLASQICKLYAVFVAAGYDVPFPERAPVQIDLEEAIAAKVAQDGAPKTARGRKKQG